MSLFEPLDDGTGLLRRWCQAAGLEYTGIDTAQDGAAVVVALDPEGRRQELSFTRLYRLAHAGEPKAKQVPSPDPDIEIIWPPRPQTMPGLPRDIRHPQSLRCSKN